MPDSVLLTLDYYYDLATRKNAVRQIYRARLRTGNIYRNQNKHQAALSNYKLARGAAQKLNNSRLEAIVIGNLGNIHLDQNEYFEAMEINMSPCLDQGISELKKNCFYFLKKNPFIKKKNFLPQD